MKRLLVTPMSRRSVLPGLAACSRAWCSSVFEVAVLLTAFGLFVLDIPFCAGSLLQYGLLMPAGRGMFGFSGLGLL